MNDKRGCLVAQKIGQKTVSECLVPQKIVFHIFGKTSIFIYHFFFWGRNPPPFSSPLKQAHMLETYFQSFARTNADKHKFFSSYFSWKALFPRKLFSSIVYCPTKHHLKLLNPLPMTIKSRNSMLRTRVRLIEHISKERRRTHLSPKNL